MTDQLPELKSVLRSRVVPAVATPPAIEADAVLSVELRKAHMIAKSGDAIPKSYRGNDGAILLAMDWANKRGLDLITALQSVSFFDGKPMIDATMQRALARQAGYRVTVSDAPATSATVTVSEQGELIGSASFTIDEAKAAGLLSKNTWKSYTEDMLVARATTRAIRRFAADVMVGLSIEDEIVDDGKAGVRGRAVQADPLSIEVDPVEAENGDSSTGTAEAGSTPDDEPLSQHEAVLRPKMRGDILAMIDQLDLPQRNKLRDWMKAKGWVLATLSSAELADVMAYVSAMVPPDDEPSSTDD